jgi:hypothetical protein
VKYIMMEFEVGGGMVQKIPLIFPDVLVHESVAKRMEHCLRREHSFVGVKTTSAGFVTFSDPQCSGRSESLELESAVGDSDIINSIDYGGGLVDG